MKKVLISIVIIVGVIIIVGGFFILRSSYVKKSQTPKLTTFEVTKGNIEVKVMATGTIRPYTRVEVKSPVSGRVEEILVDEGAKVKPGDILAWISSEDRIALLDAARAVLESAQKSHDSSQIRSAQKSYEIAEKAYKPVPLTNSIAGEVISRSCEPGQNVNTQTTLFVISDRLVASVTVDEADIGKIELGQKAQITLDAFPNEPVSAKVTKIAREGTIVSDVVVYNVLVEPEKVPAKWASGMTANVEFFVVKKDNVLLIPKSAIKERNGNQIVQVFASNKPEPRKIIAGVTDGKMVEVVEGLSEGDKILIGGPQSIGGHSTEAERRIRQMMRAMPPPGGFR
ncbi:MAG: efflux RND transporter periplasmic adaptor subunit [candidate division WOR-3 bacterium]|nr:efflux RND transporter periplasmic adaptor subunit [candidate division WOR-3 bacterium]